MAIQALRIPITASNKTGAAFAKVTKGLGGIGVQVAKLGAAFATLGVAAGVTVVRQQMKTIDALGKTADKLGITTQALGAMRHAADLTGVKTATMDMALQRFTRRAAEAAIGTGEAKGALQELNISATDLVKLPLEQQMGVVADAMQNVRTQSDRVRLAMKLFDSEGVSLLQTLKGGSQALQDMAKEADALGILLSRADVAQVEAANDSLTRSMAIFDGLSKQFTVGIAPFVEALADHMRQAALDSETFGNVGAQAARSVVMGIAKLLDFMQSVRIGLKGLEIGWESFKLVGLGALAVLVSPIQAVIDGLNKVRTAMGLEPIPPLVVDSVIETATEISRLKGELDELMAQGSFADKIEPELDKIIAGARKRAEAIAAETAATNDQTNAVKALSYAEKLRAQGAVERLKFDKMAAGERAAHVSQELANSFRENKAFNIANAIMQTYAGATKALASYPPPLNFGMAAAVVASGLKQVQQIRSQSFEGGGFTGHGARAGGMDGRGGFLAMLHPNESVVDHTRGQAGGVTVVNHVDARGADASVDMKIRQAMQQTSDQTILTIQDLMKRRRFV